MGKRRVAVVGGGLGGLTAAGELARQGHQVTLFEAGMGLGGKAQSLEVNGVVLDKGPTLLTLPQVVQRTFERLGALDLMPRTFELSEQCTYFYRDGCTFSVYRDLDRTAASAAELRPVEADGVRRFYREAADLYRAAGEPYLEAPYEGMLDFLMRVARRGPSALFKGAALGTLAELGERCFRTDHLRQFAGRFATYAGASPYQASAAFALIPHLERAFGVHHVEGGMGALAKALGRALRRLEVDIRFGRAAHWRAEGGGFRVGPEGAEEPFDAVVVNADPLASLGRDAEPLALSGYVVLLEVPRRLALPHHAVVFAEDYRREFDALFSGRAPEDPTVYFCHPAATDPSMAPEGKSGVFAMVNAAALGPSADGEPWPDAEAMRARCLEALERAAPGFRRTEARVLAERTPRDLAAEGAPGGSIYGFLPHGLFGPFARPRVRGKTPGVFYAGGGTHPGGGVPLVMLSGQFAASLCSAHLGGAG